MTPDLQALKQIVDEALARTLPQNSPIAQTLVDAMRYAALTGGKRLRPLMVCASAIAVGGTLEQALAPACAVEFIHAYSLVHDDLPAMDDDALRHGAPSNHVRFGEATAILAGDALQALAFHTLASAPGLAPETRLRTIALLAEAAGWAGMVGGQSFDLAAESQRLDQAALAALHGAKTGALIRAAVQIGAVIGDPTLPDRTLAQLGEFAGKVGLAFQVIDDVLDVTESSATLGKPANSDLVADKSTYVKVLGVDGARRLADSLLAEALDMLAGLGLHNDLLAELARRSVNRSF
jgi:geranylgeranyl pyrophosphate synthase